MRALTNPYTPNAGAEPQAIVGRDDQLESFELLLGRIERGRTEQLMIITGLRGVGKTVLLGQFRTKALVHDWVVVEVEVSKHDENDFRRNMASRLRTALLELSPKARWTNRFKHAAGVLKSFTTSMDPTGSWSAGFDVEAAEGCADHPNLAKTSRTFSSPWGRRLASRRGASSCCSTRCSSLTSSSSKR